MSDGNSTVIYKDIPGCPGYRVGNDGSVWSCVKKVSVSVHRGGFKAIIGSAWKPLSLRPNATSGRVKVELWGKCRGVHRLVLLAFIGPCPKGMECCHNDGNPANNKATNLRWDTKKANSADRTKHGRTPRGERSPMAVLNETLVRTLRLEYAQVANFCALARKHKLARNTIRRAIIGETWRHVT